MKPHYLRHCLISLAGTIFITVSAIPAGEGPQPGSEDWILRAQECKATGAWIDFNDLLIEALNDEVCRQQVLTDPGNNPIRRILTGGPHPSAGVLSDFVPTFDAVCQLLPADDLYKGQDAAEAYLSRLQIIRGVMDQLGVFLDQNLTAYMAAVDDEGNAFRHLREVSMRTFLLWSQALLRHYVRGFTMRVVDRYAKDAGYRKAFPNMNVIQRYMEDPSLVYSARMRQNIISFARELNERSRKWFRENEEWLRVGWMTLIGVDDVLLFDQEAAERAACNLLDRGEWPWPKSQVE